jgi:hypothetical protein
MNHSMYSADRLPRSALYACGKQFAGARTTPSQRRREL